MKKLTLGFLIIALIACSPKVKTSLIKSYPILDHDKEVFVIGIDEDAPASAIEIGQVKVGDSGVSTNCDWNVVIEKAQLEVRKAGGNVLKITKHVPPNMMSSCHTLTAKILKVDNIEGLVKTSNNKEVIDTTWNYAKLYVYRPGGYGALIGYDLYLGDSLLCRVKNNSKHEILINKKGQNRIWAKTESKSELPIEIEFGKEYYLKCSIGMGIMVGHPQLKLVDRTQGSMEYKSIKSN